MPPRHTAYFRGWRLGLVSAVFALAQPPTAQAFEGEVKARALPQEFDEPTPPAYFETSPHSIHLRGGPTFQVSVAAAADAEAAARRLASSLGLNLRRLTAKARAAGMCRGGKCSAGDIKRLLRGQGGGKPKPKPQAKKAGDWLHLFNWAQNTWTKPRQGHEIVVTTHSHKAEGRSPRIDVEIDPPRVVAGQVREPVQGVGRPGLPSDHPLVRAHPRTWRYHYDRCPEAGCHPPTPAPLPPGKVGDVWAKFVAKMKKSAGVDPDHLPHHDQWAAGGGKDLLKTVHDEINAAAAPGMKGVPLVPVPSSVKSAGGVAAGYSG